MNTFIKIPEKKFDLQKSIFWSFIGLSLVILMGQIFRYPTPVKDLVTGKFPEMASLEYPTVYTIFAPFFQIADHFTILSASQYWTLLTWLNIGFVFFNFLNTKSPPIHIKVFLIIAFKLMAQNLILLLLASIIILIPR